MKKLKLKSKEISNAKGDLIKLIREILETHPRSEAKRDGGKTLKKRSGDLFRNIQPEFKIDGDNIVMEVRMMEYYKWLDAGTSKMDGWFFSEEIMDSKELIKITERLLYDTVEGRVLDMISDINKK